MADLSMSRRDAKDEVMIVLSRKTNESIIVNGNIEIFVVDVRGGKVRLGIKAPVGITVNRKEIHEAIQREKDVKNTNTIEQQPAK